MPNQFQVAFLVSFSATLVVLVLLSQFIAAKLRDAGYPISHLILIGLDKKDNSGDMSSSHSPAIFFTVFFVLLSAIYAKFTFKRLLFSSVYVVFSHTTTTQVAPNLSTQTAGKSFPSKRKSKSLRTPQCASRPSLDTQITPANQILQLPFQTPPPQRRLGPTHRPAHLHLSGNKR